MVYCYFQVSQPLCLEAAKAKRRKLNGPSRPRWSRIFRSWTSTLITSCAILVTRNTCKGTPTKCCCESGYFTTWDKKSLGMRCPKCLPTYHTCELGFFFSHSSLSALATASLSLISTRPKLILTYMKIVFGGKERIMKGIFVFLFESLEILWCVFIFREIDIPPPCCDGEPPNYWWDDDSDRCLLIGTFKHGEWGKGGTVMMKWWRIPTQVDWWCSL